MESPFRRLILSFPAFATEEIFCRFPERKNVRSFRRQRARRSGPNLPKDLKERGQFGFAKGRRSLRRKKGRWPILARGGRFRDWRGKRDGGDQPDEAAGNRPISSAEPTHGHAHSSGVKGSRLYATRKARQFR